MGDPRAVEAVARLALLVLAHAWRARRSFTAASRRDGMNAAMPPIACAPRRWQVATSSSVYARMNGTVIVTCARSAALGCRNFLIDAEDVVPAAGVQPGGVLAQLVEDLVHLERCEDRLDQHRRADVPRGMPELFLRASSNTSFQRRASRWLSSLGR